MPVASFVQPVPQPGKYVPPPEGYWCEVDTEFETLTQYLKTRDDAIHADAQQFLLEWAEMRKNAVLLPWRERLMVYRKKPMTIMQAMQANIPFSWEEQMQKLPKRYEEQWNDYQELRKREAEEAGMPYVAQPAMPQRQLVA